MWGKFINYINNITIQKDSTESFLKGSYIIFLALTFFGFPIIAFAGMILSGDPGIIEKLLAYCFATFPLSALIAFFLSVILFTFKKYKVSVYIALLPLIQLFLGLVMSVLMLIIENLGLVV